MRKLAKTWQGGKDIMEVDAKVVEEKLEERKEEEKEMEDEEEETEKEGNYDKI